MGAFSTGFGIGAAIHSHKAKRKALRDSNRQNTFARGLFEAGSVSVTDLLAGQQRSITFGANKRTRAALAAGQIGFALSRGVSTVVICENANDLTTSMHTAGIAPSSMDIVDGYSRFYEPLAKRNRSDAVDIATSAARLAVEAPPEARLYIDALVTILERKGVIPYTRMLDSCPHGRLHEVISILEMSGAISIAEAANIRANLDVSPACRAAVQDFFHGVVSEATYLADKNGLISATSISELTAKQIPRVLLFEVDPGMADYSMPLIISEIDYCLKQGNYLNLVFCLDGISSWKAIAPNVERARNIAWSVIANEAVEFFEDDRQLDKWLSVCDRLIVFSQSPESAEALSAHFGEYDKTDITITNTNNNSIGRFGYHFAGADGITKALKRERVIKPEEIRQLPEGHFYASERRQCQVLHGWLM